jgi:hypothetical protein
MSTQPHAPGQLTADTPRLMPKVPDVFVARCAADVL